MSGIDLSTAAGALRFAELRRQEMRGFFSTHGRWEVNGASFGSYVFATRLPPNDYTGAPGTWKPGPKRDRVEAMPCSLPEAILAIVPHQRHTELFSRALREYARVTAAIGTLMLLETWMASVPGTTSEEAHAAREKLPESLEHAPGRVERLLCILEHSATGRRWWSAEIDRNPTRLGPWQEHDIADAEGRMVNLSAWQS